MMQTRQALEVVVSWLSESPTKFHFEEKAGELQLLFPHTPGFCAGGLAGSAFQTKRLYWGRHYFKSLGKNKKVSET